MNIENEKIKRRYIGRLREAEGMSESTIDVIERAVCLWDEFSHHATYKSFNQLKAIGFKKWLENRTHNGNPVSIKTVYHQLRHVSSFFKWLSGQSGYKSRIDLDAVSYLTLDRKSVRIATALAPVRYPSLEHVLKLTESIELKTEIDQRDQALIAFMLLSGMRDLAIATLPLGCFDMDSLRVSQDPSRGVKTKFSKSIQSVLLPFNTSLIDIVRNWTQHLLHGRAFCSDNPLFPRNKVEQIQGGLTFTSTVVEPVFWKTAGSIRRILRQRSEAVGLDYYNPHSFRHAAVHLAMKRCRTAEEMKAVSQNFGHEHIGTTISTYGKLDDQQVPEIIGAIKFDVDHVDLDREATIDQAQQLLEQLKRR